MFVSTDPVYLGLLAELHQNPDDPLVVDALADWHEEQRHDFWLLARIHAGEWPHTSLLYRWVYVRFVERVMPSAVSHTPRHSLADVVKEIHATAQRQRQGWFEDYPDGVTEEQVLQEVVRRFGRDDYLPTWNHERMPFSAWLGQWIRTVKRGHLEQTELGRDPVTLDRWPMLSGLIGPERLESETHLSYLCDRMLPGTGTYSDSIRTLDDLDVKLKWLREPTRYRRGDARGRLQCCGRDADPWRSLELTRLPLDSTGRTLIRYPLEFHHCELCNTIHWHLFPCSVERV